MKPSFDLYVIDNFLDPGTCEQIIAETRSLPDVAATVYGGDDAGYVNERIRKASRFAPSAGLHELVTRRIEERQGEVAKHFDVVLRSCDEPQFLRYREGDFFVAHQDGNTGLIKSDREERLVSVVIFLSKQSGASGEGDYSGGSLVFSEYRPGRRGQLEFPGEPGMLVAFRSETTHEVMPVTSGERHSIACWYR